MYIPAFPTFSLFDLFQGGENQINFPPLNTANTYYYFRGANAIFNGIKMLNLDSEENILMPAYHDGMEVEAILAAGVKVKFYNVTEKLEVDLDDINRRIDGKTKVLFIAHYFGFPQPLPDIKKFCEEKRLYLIENCSQALYSRFQDRLLGRLGDISIFSFHKSLPTPDGGALIVNRDGVRIITTVEKPRFLMVAREVALILLERLRTFSEECFQMLDWTFIKPTNFLWRVLKRTPKGSFMVRASMTSDFDTKQALMGMSELSMRIIKKADVRDIINKRRDNFQFLLARLNNTPSIRLFYRTLPMGVCPLFLPILVDNRDRLHNRLKERGIETFVFGREPHPSLPKSQFPFVEMCSNQNLCLPIHQDLERTHLAYIIRMIKVEMESVGKLEVDELLSS